MVRTPSKDSVDASTDAEDVVTPSAADSKADGSPSKTDTTDAAMPAARDRGIIRLLRGMLSVRLLVIGVVIVVMVACIGVLGWQVSTKADKISDMQGSQASTEHAEKVALDYAVGAAEMNYEDLGAWNKRLAADTKPELSAKLKEAASSMEQVIVPLKWTSTAQPITAKVQSHNGDTYVVAAFVSVVTKNLQATEGVQSTASYTVTLDSSKGWQIADVGGIDSDVAPK